MTQQIVYLFNNVVILGKLAKQILTIEYIHKIMMRS